MLFDLSSLSETCKCDDPNCSCNIPGYGQDHNSADASEQGEDPATSSQNIPALTAAKTAGGVPFAATYDNGINAKGSNVINPSQVNPKFRFNDGDDDDDDQEDSYGDDDDDDSENKYARKSHHEGFHF